MTHQTNVSESGGIRARAGINPVVTMIMSAVTPIANLGVEYRRELVGVPPQGQRWTKRQTVVVP
jgi:hypothetical protein